MRGIITEILVEFYEQGRIIFSREPYFDFGDAVSYRLRYRSGYRSLGYKEKLLHKMILELTESVMAQYGVFSIIGRLGTPGTHEKPRKYESKKGLADDIYDYLQETKSEPVWRTNKSVALWSYGHHDKLMRHLDKTCRSSSQINPYWNGDFYMYGFRNIFPGSNGEEQWKQLSAGKLSPDLIVSYKEDSKYIWIDFLFQRSNRDEEKRICRLVKAACDRHNVKPILENIDPSMMEFGYDVEL